MSLTAEKITPPLGRAPQIPPTPSEQQILQRFPRLLRKLMDERGLDQSDLALMTSTTKQAVSSWMRGENHPAPLNMIRLAKALKVDVSTLWGGPRIDIKRRKR